MVRENILTCVPVQDDVVIGVPLKLYGYPRK
jgi:hypothetical protein